MNEELEKLEKYLRSNGFVKEASVISKIADEGDYDEDGTYRGSMYFGLMDCNSGVFHGQDVLMTLLGLIPGYGIAFDLKSFAENFYCGNYVTAALSLLAAIPGIGMLAGLAKASAGGTGVISAARAVNMTKRAKMFKKSADVGSVTMKQGGKDVEIFYYLDDMRIVTGGLRSRPMTAQEIIAKLTGDFALFEEATSFLRHTMGMRGIKTVNRLLMQGRIKPEEITKFMVALRAGQKSVIKFFDAYKAGLLGWDQEAKEIIRNGGSPCDTPGTLFWMDENDNMHRCIGSGEDSSEDSYEDKKRKRPSASEAEEIERLINED